jgi:ribosomal subunit interface protein
MKGQVTLICQHDRLHTAEVDLQAGSARFHASETSPDMYASIDKVIDKLERQIGSAKDAETAKKKGADKAAARLPEVPSED